MRVKQKEKIVAYCKEHGSITARDAFIKLGINSPRKVISAMHRSGKYIVDTLEESRVDEGGYRTRWNRYYIKEREVERNGCEQ
jgi:hypothetical protein